ncbi:hypothetical protein SETIT_7G321100v2 [Setaria italica]|uniref:Uncharacterized protein n=1 Tax=Setaria italica TaxID=4555 RepID=A0A368S204_SETIT|nr:hypothetical protein SETIT_7G321100v2 [Setaria italica]
MLIPAKLGPTGLLMEWKLPMLISCNLQVARGAIRPGEQKTTNASLVGSKGTERVALLNRSTALLLSAGVI